MNGSTSQTIENFVALINDSMYVTSFVGSSEKKLSLGIATPVENW